MCKLVVYTDGSCSKRGAGCGVHFPNKEFADISNKFIIAPITNQRAELYAIYTCLLTIDQSRKHFDQINLYTDSMYSINCFTNWIYTWSTNNFRTSDDKPVKNLDIILPTYKLIQNLNVMFHHVRSHTGKTDVHSVGNSVADNLATSYKS